MMEIKTLIIRQLTCKFVDAKCDKICYILTPKALDDDWVVKQAMRHSCSIVVVSDMDWDNDLTPWQASGVFRRDPMFEGKANELLALLREELIPTIENMLGVTAPKRILVGISLSGLFAMWAWMQGEEFNNVATVSGSYWYDGFIEWLRLNVQYKVGTAYMSLGDQEPAVRNIRFSTIGERTADVVKILQDKGINTSFQWNPGNHYADVLLRLEKAMTVVCS